VAHETAVEDQTLELPLLVSSPVEIGRLIRELEDIDEKLRQLGLRDAGSEVKMPQTTRLMDQIVELNELNLLHAIHREALKKLLADVKATAPALHMSFSADPSPAFIEKLMSWLRREIDPQLLLTVGLQPNLGAGCMVRSTNHQFDFSLREDFIKKKPVLVEKLAALSRGAGQ
jgi:F0F1-type ATP synthase delta subunit